MEQLAVSNSVSSLELPYGTTGHWLSPDRVLIPFSYSASNRTCELRGVAKHVDTRGIRLSGDSEEKTLAVLSKGARW